MRWHVHFIELLKKIGGTPMKRLGILFLLLPMLLLGCKQSITPYTDAVFTGMDTVITLRLAADTDEATYQVAVQTAEDTVQALEKSLSCHDETSELSALNGSVQHFLTEDEVLRSVLDTALHICDLTGGAYDPTLGTLTDLWNVANGGPVPKETSIETARSHIGTDKLQWNDDGTITKTDPELRLDLGGIGKGYGLQMVLSQLQESGIAYGLVSFGGNIGVFGEKPDGTPFQIGVKDPHDTSSVVGYLYIPNGFVSVSGDYERYFRQDGVIYHHILDSETGYPADTGLSSVAVYANNGAAADALSTALFVMGVEDAMDFYASGTISFEAMFITADNRILLTPGLTDQFSLTAKNYKIVEE